MPPREIEIKPARGLPILPAPPQVPHGFAPPRATPRRLRRHDPQGAITGAQQALAQLQADRSATYSRQGQPSFGDTLKNDFSALVSAVQSGDVQGAQQALSALQSDMQKAVGAHHHHHGGDPAAGPGPGVAVPAPPSATGSDPDGDNDTGSEISQAPVLGA